MLLPRKIMILSLDLHFLILKTDLTVFFVEEFNWYVVKTNVRSEKKVNERLIQAGFETYLPLQQTIKIWSDRKKKVEVPLIASTLFVYTTAQALTRIYPITGVSSILMYLKKPAIVHDYEINNLRILLQQDVMNASEQKLELLQGETVQVTRGPFQGLIATAINTGQKFRVVVELESLGTSFSVNVPKSYVRKINR